MNRVLQGNLVLTGGVVERGLVVIEDGIIVAVAAPDAAQRYRPTDDYGQSYIAPGFIDLHTHGIAGVDTMDASAEALATMARRFALHGVTAFLPTTMTAPLEDITQAVLAVRRHMERQGAHATGGARILGVHVEGPWISRSYQGAQSDEHIVPPAAEALESLLAHGAGAIRIVTLAPEIPGADEAIRTLRSHDVYVSLGHSGATYEEAAHAIALGATQATHLFNAMSPFHHRQPGIVGATLLHGDVFAELIADGVHAHPAAMRLLIKAKGRERVMLITDSMEATAMPDGTFALGGQEVRVQDGQARLPDGTLAGSTLTLDRAVRNVHERCGISLHDAIYMATAVPATAIGLGGRTGQMAVGFDADITILDRDLQPSLTMVRGNIVSRRPPAVMPD